MISLVKYGNLAISEIFPDSENHCICLTVENIWKSPYSHTVDKSSICWWESQGWPAPNSAGYMGTVDLEQMNINQ